jgi:hypothetical protein
MPTAKKKCLTGLIRCHRLIDTCYAGHGHPMALEDGMELLSRNEKVVISPKLASRTPDNDLAGEKSERQGQKIYNLSSQPIQNTGTLEEQNQKQNHF